MLTFLKYVWFGVVVQVNNDQVLVMRTELGKRVRPLRYPGLFTLCFLGEDVKLMLAKKLKT